MKKISIFSWWISKPCLRTPHATRDATSLELWSANSAINPIHQKKIFPARFVLLANHTCWDRGLSLLFFPWFHNTLYNIYACLYVFCLSACVSWESINLKLNTPGHYLQSRKTPASWNNKATKHPHSRRVTIFTDFPWFSHIFQHPHNEEQWRALLTPPQQKVGWAHYLHHGGACPWAKQQLPTPRNPRPFQAPLATACLEIRLPIRFPSNFELGKSC